MSDLERRLLSYATNTEALAKVHDAGLRGEAFKEPISRAVYEFSIAYWLENQMQKAPTAYAIETEFPGFKVLADVEESSLWLAESLKRRCAVNDLQEIVREAASASHDDPISALRTMEEKSKEARERAGKIGGDDGRPKLWSATDLKAAEQPRWLAKNRLPRGAVSLLVGDEGIGKSLFWVYLAAAITTGKPLPEFGIPVRDPGHVVIVVTEDDWSTTVCPRLEVAGTNLAMVHAICIDEDGSGAPEFPRDLYLITEADPAPALVVVDAWLDTVPSKLSVRDPQLARQALHPWREVAVTTDAAVLLLTHTNRVASANPRDKYGATGELRKKARMSLFAQRDEDGNLVVGPDKANTARAVMASRFTVSGVQHFPPTDDHDGMVPLLTYVGDSDQTAQEHIAAAYSSVRRSGNDDSATGWVARHLADGPRWANEMYAAAEEEGFSTDKIKRARKSIGVESIKSSSGRWLARLPGDQRILPREDQQVQDQGSIPKASV